MSRYHIVHIIPDSRMHILSGYNEVIKTLFWGLRCLGHEVSYAANAHRPDAVNIVFGANMAHISLTDSWPDGTIIYNLEQISPVLDQAHMRLSFERLSRQFAVWDYSEENIKSWKIVNPDCAPTYVPIGFAPILETIPRDKEKDIDILIYGGPSENRLNVFRDLCLRGATALFAFGVYGDARDELIARSKLVLNISHHHAEIFSIVRVSYLLSNHKAVIADVHPGLSVEPDMFNAVQFTPLERFADTCMHYLQDDAARAQLERNAYLIMAQRDIRKILAAATAGQTEERQQPWM
jgi:hypothetical protein